MNPSYEVNQLARVYPSAVHNKEKAKEKKSLNI